MHGENEVNLLCVISGLVTTSKPSLQKNIIVRQVWVIQQKESIYYKIFSYVYVIMYD